MILNTGNTSYTLEKTSVNMKFSKFYSELHFSILPCLSKNLLDFSVRIEIIHGSHSLYDIKYMKSLCNGLWCLTIFQFYHVDQFYILVEAAASDSQTLSHKVVSNTPRHEWDLNSQL
jgi:hypothetical protein